MVSRWCRLIDPKATMYSVTRRLICIVAHSTGFVGELELTELLGKIHSDPARPTVTPYKTTYYSKEWGLCLPDIVKRGLQPGKYKVVIRASYKKECVPYAEAFITGTETRELLLTSYICHPSMANNETSGMVVWSCGG